MKYNKLISITLFNSFLLFIFASLLSSCDKRKIHASGFLTKLNKEQGRKIASIGIKRISFFDYQDTTQILVFCKVSSKKPKSCYNTTLQKILEDYETKYGKLSISSKTNIASKSKYSLVERKLDENSKFIKNKLKQKMNKIVTKRENFCKVNSKKYLKRCLNQYLKRDTFSVLNSFQIQNSKMNSHEYLYYKNFINNSLSKKLDKSYKKLL